MNFDTLTIPAIVLDPFDHPRDCVTEGLSQHTVKELSTLVSQEKQGQRVHSVFGEGVNPRMRKIRDGLNALGVSSDEILTHGSPRLIYGVGPISNLTEYILGIQQKCKYYLPRQNANRTSNKISTWWLKRWVCPRIKRKDVLDRIARHTLIHPIRHRAGVELPQAEVEQGLLFGE